MGKEQEFIQAAKNGDVAFIRKQVSKFRSARASEVQSVLSSDPLMRRDFIENKLVLKKAARSLMLTKQMLMALHHAALQGNAEIIIGLQEMEGDPNIRDLKGMCPLHLAAWGGKVEAAKLLIDAGANVNSCSNNMQTPLHMASEHGHHVVAEALLEHGADPTLLNENSRTSLDLACQFGHRKVVDLLIRSQFADSLLSGTSDRDNSQSPMHLASKHGHVEVVRMLLESGADVNLAGDSGTCLHEAALYGKTEVVRLLLEAGVNVFDKNSEDMTALDIVNKFTSSCASSGIKRLLKEAEGSEVLFGRAIADYCNVYDPGSLSFHCGDMIMVLDQSEVGKWKGAIKDGQRERVGHFPSTAIRMMSRQACQAQVRKQTSLKSPPKLQGPQPTQVPAAVEVVPVKTLGSTSPPPLRQNKSRVSSFTHRQPHPPSSSTSS